MKIIHNIARINLIIPVEQNCTDSCFLSRIRFCTLLSTKTFFTECSCKSAMLLFVKMLECVWNKISFTFLYDYAIHVKQEYSLFSGLFPIRNHISFHKCVSGSRIICKEIRNFNISTAIIFSFFAG